MSRNRNLLILVVSILLVMFSITSIKAETVKTSDTTDIKNVITRYFNDYYQSFVTYKLNDNTSSYIIENDNTFLFKKIYEYDVLTSKNLGTGYEDYKLDLKYSSIHANTDTADVSMKRNIDYHYKGFSDIDSGLYDTQYNFVLKKINGNWMIQNISTNNEDYDYFISESGAAKTSRSTFSKDYQQQINSACDKLVAESKTQNKELKNLNKHEEADKESISTFATGVNYSYANGVSYAKRFAKEKRFFYIAPNGNDCTNFISQCVWAGYGGYNKSNDAKTKSNIKNKYRMVKNVWQGGTGGGTSNWESVNSFWKYVQKAKSSGPKGTGYNNNKLVKSLTGIQYGDVLQSRRDGERDNYKHSTYVTLIKDRQTFVTQHNRKSRAVTAWIKYNGGVNHCYIRGIHFKHANF